MAWQTVGTQIQRPETELRGEKEFIVYFSQRGRKAVVRLRIARIQQTDCPGFGWSGRRVEGSGEQAGSQVGRWRDGVVQESSAEGARQNKGWKATHNSWASNRRLTKYKFSGTSDHRWLRNNLAPSSGETGVCRLQVMRWWKAGALLRCCLHARGHTHEERAGEEEEEDKEEKNKTQQNTTLSSSTMTVGRWDMFNTFFTNILSTIWGHLLWWSMFNGQTYQCCPAS